MMIIKSNVAIRMCLILLLIGIGVAYHSSAFAEEDMFKALQMSRFPEPVEVPEFTLPSIDGKDVNISDYKGNLIFLNFWTTW